MGNFCEFFFMELSARDTCLFSFLDDNSSKCQWIFSKLGICIDIVEVWFRTANGQIFYLRHANSVVLLFHILLFSALSLVCHV